MSESFKTGDVVQLKSGGPKMTVSSGASEDHVWCDWFAGSKSERKAFKAGQLTLAKDEEKPSGE